MKRDLPPAARHNYGRHWRRLTAAERDRRIGIALQRIAAGETLADVAPTWSICASALCMTLLAYAPRAYHEALSARELVRMEDALRTLDQARDPGQIAAAGRKVKLRQWVLDRVLARTYGRRVQPFGGRSAELCGECLACGTARAVYIRRGNAECHACGWRGTRAAYLACIISEAPA